jgi:hypothetical protein
MVEISTEHTKEEQYGIIYAGMTADAGMTSSFWLPPLHTCFTCLYEDLDPTQV